MLPKEKLEQVFDWIDDFSQEKIKIIGGFEVLGALGLFLPGAFSMPKILIPLSASGLAIIMILAALTHYNRNEKPETIVNIILFVLLSVVIIGRLAF